MATENHQTAVRGVNSVEHALRLIAHLAQEAAAQGATATELTRELGLPRPTVYRVLTTLQSQGWVTRESRRYRLTLRLLELAESAFSMTTMQAVCQPHLAELARSTGETAHFAVLDGVKAGYIAKVDGEHAIRMSSHVGWRGPLHATAVGKVLLAWSEPSITEALLAQPLERYTDKTLVDSLKLVAELGRVRSQGYAIDDEELLQGLVCVAAPVIAQGRLLGAISISGPDSRREALVRGAVLVREAADAVARALG